MRKLRFVCFIMIFVAFIIIVNSLDLRKDSVQIHQEASAHFFGLPILQNQTVAQYKVVFQPYPTVPLAGANSTQINLSILDKENQNINSIFASLSIKEKDTGKILKNFTYKFHDFSDLTFPYTFPNATTYVVSLQFKINGDPVYADKPLIVDFDLPVANQGNNNLLPQILIYYLIPALIVIVGIAIYLRKKKKI